MLDLDEGSVQTVVEGIIYDSLGHNYVLLSKSLGYYETGDLQSISGASVVVTDDNGGTFVFNEVSDGFYTNPTLEGIPNTTYSLRVEIDGKVITATAYLPPVVPIDSLTILEGFGAAPGEEQTYTVRVNWNDPAGVDNFYRFKAKANGEPELFFQTTDDTYADGIATALPIFEPEFFSGDTVTAELLSVDQANFDYFLALELIADGQGTPGNPPTNLLGDNVLGYFGAYSSSEMTQIIP